MSMYDMVEVMPNEESEGAVLSGMFGESAAWDRDHHRGNPELQAHGG